MSAIDSQASSRRSAVRTEVRAPLEVVITRVVWFVFGAIDVLLALRFMLLLLGANANAGFVQFIYNVTDVFMAPFHAVFETSEVEGAIFEWSSLLAIVIYALVAWGIAALIRAIVPREHAETVKRVEAEEDVTTE